MYSILKFMAGWRRALDTRYVLDILGETKIERRSTLVRRKGATLGKPHEYENDVLGGRE